MSDISYTELQTLLVDLVRNLESSKKTVAQNEKLDAIATGIKNIQDALIKNPPKDGKIDYDKLGTTVTKSVREASPPPPPTPSNDNLVQQLIANSSNTNSSSPIFNQLTQSFKNGGKGLDDIGKEAEDASQSIKNMGKDAGETTRRSSRDIDRTTQKVLRGIQGIIKLGVGDIEQRTNLYRDMLSNGYTFTNNLNELSHVANVSGQSLSTFKQAINTSTVGSRQLGLETFAKVSRGLMDANVKFGSLGLTVEQQNSQFSSYTERLRLSGNLQNQTSTSLITGFRNVIQSATTLASAVGTSRDAILEASKNILDDSENQVTLSSLAPNASENVLNFLSGLQSSLGKSGPMITKAIIDQINGHTTESDAQTIQSIGIEAYNKALSSVRSLQNTTGPVSPTEITSSIGEFVRLGQEFVRSRATNSLVAASADGNNMAKIAVQATADLNQANVNLNRVRSTKQTPDNFTNGFLNVGQTAEQLKSMQQEAFTIMLENMRHTISSILGTYEAGVNEATHKLVDGMRHFGNAVNSNPIDDFFGNHLDFTKASSGMLTAIGSVTVGLSSLATAINFFIAGTLTNFIGEKIAGFIFKRLAARFATTAAVGAAEEAAAVGGTGLLASAGGALAAAVPIVGSLLPTIGAVGYGLYSNHKSQQKFERGEITERQNNIKHDANDGMMGGAVVGATIGTMVFPGLGTAIGGGLGAAIGYFAGEGLGEYFNPDDTSKKLSPKSEEQSTDDQNKTQPQQEKQLDLEQHLSTIENDLSTLVSLMTANNSISSQNLANIERNTNSMIGSLARASNAI